MPITSIAFSLILDTFCFWDIFSIAIALSLKYAAFSYSCLSAATFISSFNFFKSLTDFPSNNSIISYICFLYSSVDTILTHGPKHLPMW